jgi:hypothetical protein
MFSLLNSEIQPGRFQSELEYNLNFGISRP